MLGEESVGKEVTEKVRTYDWGRSNMVMFMALDRPLEYKAGENVAKAPAIHLSEPSLDQLKQNSCRLQRRTPSRKAVHSVAQRIGNRS